MKKLCKLLVLLSMMFLLCACGSSKDGENDDVMSESTVDSTEEQAETSQEQEMQEDPATVPETPTETPEEPIATAAPEKTPQAPSETDSDFVVDVSDIATIEELETHITEYMEGLIASLYSDWEALSQEIDSYEKYCKNQSVVSDFYEKVMDETEQMCIIIYEYSAIYARMILDSDMSDEDKYDCIEGINKFIYDDICELINDEIYEDLLGDMHDYYYEGILEDAKDSVEYGEWYDIYSNEYEQWYDTGSEVYSMYYDTASEIYSFYYDMSGELYSSDFERAEKVYARFCQKINRVKGIEVVNASFPDISFDTTISTAATAEELEEVIEEHVSECIQSIWLDWENLSQEIDTYDEYVNNLDKIEDFHLYIEDSTNEILIMINEYAIVYAELIMESEVTSKDKYNDFEDIKDCIYEDACEMVKDEIYDDLLAEVKDFYYDGILKDAKDSVEYSEWSDVRSDTYGWYSDAHGEVYSDYSDARGDIYSFYSDMRGELYSGDMAGAEEELQKFKEKVSKRR